VALELFKHATTRNILGLLESAIDEHGWLREVLTDHGTQFYASRGGKSGFTRFCEENNIRHIYGGIGKPTFLGKVERFNRIFKELFPRFNCLEVFTDHYNFEKPYRGLNYATSASIAYISDKRPTCHKELQVASPGTNLN